MADQKVSELVTELTSPAINDRFHVVDDPAGVPSDAYMTMQGLLDWQVIGEISVEGNATATTFSASSTDFTNKVQITVFDANGESENTTPDHTNDHITILVAGKRRVAFTLSFSGGSSDTYSFAVFKNNGATQLGTRCTRKIGTGGDIGSASIQCTHNFSANDTVEVWMQCESGTASATIEDCSLIVW